MPSEFCVTILSKNPFFVFCVQRKKGGGGTQEGFGGLCAVCLHSHGASSVRGILEAVNPCVLSLTPVGTPHPPHGIVSARPKPKHACAVRKKKQSNDITFGIFFLDYFSSAVNPRRTRPPTSTSHRPSAHVMLTVVGDESAGGAGSTTSPIHTCRRIGRGHKRASTAE